MERGSYWVNVLHLIYEVMAEITDVLVSRKVHVSVRCQL